MTRSELGVIDVRTRPILEGKNICETMYISSRISPNLHLKAMNTHLDDWNAYALEMWGISIASWTPLPERAEKLPEPLEYDILQDGLMELEQAERRIILQGVSCYQVRLILIYFRDVV
jgi:hypothetical protein